jgi:hypothetical protein
MDLEMEEAVPNKWDLDRLLAALMEFQDDTRHVQGLINRGTGGRELALAQTKLDEARLWLAEAHRVLMAGAK